MTKTLLAATAALAFAVPALAQTAATPPANTTTQSTTTTTTAPADPTDPASPQTTTSTTTATTAAAPVPAADPKAALAQQFPTYDKDGNGSLSKAEFVAWLTELKTAQNTEKLTPAQIDAWAGTSFAQADKDKSKTVTVAELQGFLVPNA